MSSAFEQLKAKLEQEKKLSTVEIQAVTLTEEERMWIESERFRLVRESQETVTMEEYLDALKVLDSAEEGSTEYKIAETLVQRYESGS
jgi:hypothetical protein